ncbi:MAG: hypothetical protein IKT65_05875 [Clostridia bacterium]|nr:hypothetical protein [Clostridia bacterium]
MKHITNIKGIISSVIIASFLFASPAIAYTSLKATTQNTEDAGLESVVDSKDASIGWDNAIQYANSVKNGVQVRYDSPQRLALQIENNSFTATYNLATSNKLISSFKNKSGTPYFTDSSDAYFESSSGLSFASNSNAVPYFNSFRLGYYYYDVHILGQNIQDDSITLSSQSYNLLNTRTRYWSGYMVSNVTCRNNTLSYKVTDVTDPFCFNTNINFSTESYNAIQITIKSQASDSCAIYFYTDAVGTFTAEQCVSFKITPGQSGTYTIPISHLPNYTGNVRGIRIDCGKEVNETISVSALKAVKATIAKPTVKFERTFHTYSEKLHDELRFIADENVSDIRSVGVQTKIPVSSVSRVLLSDPSAVYTSVSGKMTSLVTAAFDTDAGVIGFIVPNGDNMGNISVEIVNGYYVINRYLSINYLSSGQEIKLSTRVYNDETHDFASFNEEAYIERNPLTNDNIKVNANVSGASYSHYDPYTGAYVFNVDGMGFNTAYYNYPNRYYFIPITVTGDSYNRHIYIKSHTIHGSLESGAVIDENKDLLPIPVEVCKNFCGEFEENVYYPDDTSFGEIYFPLALNAGEEKTFTVINLYQHWGKYPLKQLSSIKFFVSYYHLSMGVSETNCISPYFVNGKDGWTLPDFRALSGALWEDQPQHYSGGQIYFLKYTDSSGKSYKSETQNAKIHSAGPLYADIDMEYISDDGKIKAEYKHIELPQTDETRTNYQIKLTVLEDVSFSNFKRDFSFVSFDGRHVFYQSLSYLDENNKVAKKSLAYDTSTVDYITLGDNAPFFCYYQRQGTSYQVTNMALMIKNHSITVNGKAYSGRFVLKNTYLNNMNYGALTLDLGAVTLKKGDVISIDAVLLPWGDPDDTDITSVLNVRNDSCLDPYKLTVTEGKDISEPFLPSVRSNNGMAEFTISGGDNHAVVRIYGFDSYVIDGLYEIVNGEYVKYDTGNNGYDGYQVYYDEDGTYSFAYNIDMSGGQSRTFTVMQNGTMGDVNGDGVVNVCDIIRLKKYLADPTAKIRKNLAMLNDDDIIDIQDLVVLVELITK